MQTLVSVIIPVYNSEQYLEECIRSVLAQTFECFELLLIDDGSTDNSREICGKMRKADERIQYLPREHSGVSAARNAGIMTAKGTYLFFLDSDDTIHPQLLETLYLLLEKHHCKMAREEFFHMTSESNPSEQQCPAPETDSGSYTLLSSSKALDCLVRESPIKDLSGIGGQMIRRDYLQSFLFDTTLSNGEDTKLIYQLLSKGADMIVLHRKWYYYRTHVVQSSRIPTLDAWAGIYASQTYIRDCEEEAGRIQNAAVREGILITFLGAWYVYGRKIRDTERIEYIKQLMEKELNWPHFSRIPFSARLSFFLARHIQPLYLLAHNLCLCMKK